MPASHGDNDLPASVALREIPERLGDLGQRVGFIDDRRDLSGLEEFVHEEQVLVVWLRNKRSQALAHEG